MTNLVLWKWYVIVLSYYSTLEPLYCEHHWNKSKCPDYRGVFISEAVLYTTSTFGTTFQKVSSVIIEVSLIRSVKRFHCNNNWHWTNIMLQRYTNWVNACWEYFSKTEVDKLENLAGQLASIAQSCICAISQLINWQDWEQFLYFLLSRKNFNLYKCWGSAPRHHINPSQLVVTIAARHQDASAS